MAKSRSAPSKQVSKKRTHKPAPGKKGSKSRVQNPDQQGDRANVRQNTRNIDRRHMR
jgi:hypothetical protein